MSSSGNSNLRVHNVQESHGARSVHASSACKSCGNEVTQEVPGRYCRDCAIKASLHKFRSCMGRNKFRGGRVIVVHSNRAQSSVLLHMLSEWQKSVEGMLPLTCYILFYKEVTDGALDGFNQNAEESLKKLASDLGYDTYEAPNDVMCKLNDIKCATSRKYLQHQARMHMAVEAAKVLDCSYIFFDSTRSEQAVQLLSSVAQGRGAQLTQDVGMSAKFNIQEKSITVLRPLFELLDCELSLYTTLKNLHVYCFEDAKEAKISTVEQASMNFIRSVQESFPSTESCLLRTCSKLTEASQRKCSTCDICFGPVITEGEKFCYACNRAVEYAKLPEEVLHMLLHKRCVT